MIAAVLVLVLVGGVLFLLGALLAWREGRRRGQLVDQLQLSALERELLEHRAAQLDEIRKVHGHP